MNKESKEKMDIWMSGHPESMQPMDEERMFVFSNTLFETDDNISVDEIFDSFIGHHSNYRNRMEEARRLSDEWEDQILMIKRFLAWRKEKGGLS